MHSSTKSNLLVASCYAGILALGMAVGPKFGDSSTSSTRGGSTYFTFGKAEKVERVLEIIKDNYVDSVKVDTLQNLAINQILSHLDPHSSYLPPIKARDLSQDLEGNYNGIGIEYFLLNDTMLVSAVNEKGPAAKAGIKAGDRILQIDSKIVAGNKTSSEKIVSLIKGRRNSSVKLLVRRAGTNTESIVEINRDKIVVSSIDAAYMVTSNTGYIKLSKFGAKTDDDFSEAITKLKKNGLKSLILDLRHNGGGYLNAATALADEFLPEKKLIVYTQGRHEPRTDYFATNDGQFEQGKIAILIDENTASASEIVAGALQDLDRAVVIGRRSFGKGLVQEQFNFGDGSALNLTIARYYTPLGRSIQRPYKMRAEEYFEEPSKRSKADEEELQNAKDSLPQKSQSYKTTSGKVLYGGGGIMPDIYMPRDTIHNTAFYYALKARGLLTEYLFNHALPSKTPISVTEIINSYDISDETYQKLLSFASQKGLKAKANESALSRTAINNEYQAFLARYYFGAEAFYKVINSTDKVIARSLLELK